MSFADLVAITPGFIALEVYHLLSPNWRPSDFAWAIRSLILSAVLYGPFVIGRRYGHDFIADKALFVPFSWTFACIAGYAIHRVEASAWSKKVWKYFNPETIHGLNIWTHILSSPGNAPLVKAVCCNGSIYVGTVEIYTINPNDPNRELFLRPAMLMSPEKNGNFMCISNIRLGVHINASQLSSLELMEEISPQPAPVAEHSGGTPPTIPTEA